MLTRLCCLTPFFHAVFGESVASLASMWQKGLVQNKTWKVILTLSLDGNHLNAIYYWPPLEFKCGVCYQTQAVKGGARVLWCIPGLHIGQAFFSLIIGSCMGKGCLNVYDHSEEQTVASQWSWPSKYRAGVRVCLGLVLMFVQVSVADVMVWYSRKEIYWE